MKTPPLHHATAAGNYEALVTGTAPHVGAMIAALRQFGANQMMAYLVMMGARLVQLHRVLPLTTTLRKVTAPTGPARKPQS